MIEMPTFEFEVQILRTIRMEGIDKEEARAELCDTFHQIIDWRNSQPYISDGKEIKDTTEFNKRIENNKGR